MKHVTLRFCKALVRHFIEHTRAGKMGGFVGWVEKV